MMVKIVLKTLINAFHFIFKFFRSEWSLFFAQLLLLKRNDIGNNNNNFCLFVSSLIFQFDQSIDYYRFYYVDLIWKKSINSFFLSEKKETFFS